MTSYFITNLVTSICDNVFILNQLQACLYKKLSLLIRYTKGELTKVYKTPKISFIIPNTSHTKNKTYLKKCAKKIATASHS